MEPSLQDRWRVLFDYKRRHLGFVAQMTMDFEFRIKASCSIIICATLKLKWASAKVVYKDPSTAIDSLHIFFKYLLPLDAKVRYHVSLRKDCW